MTRWLIATCCCLPWLLYAKPKPYNEAYYDISYQSFVGASKVEKAMQVAQDALYWQPDNLLWRRRLAESSLWSGEHEQALDASIKIARATQNIEDWQQVIKLAPYDYNFELVLEARIALLHSLPYDADLIKNIENTYVLLGKEAEGLAFFQNFNKKYPSKASLQSVAQMAKLSGYELLAATYNEQYFEKYGYETGKVAATIDSYWLLGRQQKAYELAGKALETNQSPRIVRRCAAMAYSLGLWLDSLNYYMVLLEQGEDSQIDRLYYLNLLRLYQPEALPETTQKLWVRSGESLYASQLFYALLEQRDYATIEEFLRGQTISQRQELAKDDEFARVLALYYQKIGQYNKARETLKRAFRLAPEAQANRVAWLWFLIEVADRDQLQLLVNHWQASLTTNEPGLRVLSASLFALGQGDDAVKYEREVYKKAPNSWQKQWFYWQALQSAGKHNAASKILHKLSKSLPDTLPSKDQATFYYAAKQQLILRHGNGSQMMEFNQHLLNEPTLSKGQKAELTIRWAQVLQSPELATRWYQRYARQQFYQHQQMVLANALYQGDTEAVRTVFTEPVQHLSLPEALTVAISVGETGTAKKIYSQLQLGMPNWADQQLYQEALSLNQANAWQFNVRYQRQGGLNTQKLRLFQQKAIGDFSTWSLAVEGYRYQDDEQSFFDLDEREQQLHVGFSTSKQQNFLAVDTWLRQLFDETRLGFNLKWQAPWQYGFSSQLEAVVNEPANETSLLNVLGERTGARGLINWQTQKWWQNSINAAFYQYHDIGDNYQGRSQVWDVISEFRPWRNRFSPGVRLQTTLADFYDKQGLAEKFDNISRLPANARVLPNDYWQVQASLLLGQQDIHIRAHRLHGWAEIGILENSVFGQGYATRAGIEGDLLGRDEWQLLLEKSFNQGGIQDSSYSIEFNYKMYY